MRAIILDYPNRSLAERDIPEPAIASESDVLFCPRRLGVCATDRFLAQFRFGFAPPGDSYMVLGHEALGTVVATGSGVTSLRPGDLVIATVRRGCSPPCQACSRGRSDLCRTGGYRERGIFGAHGFFTECVADSAGNLIPVPEALVETGVLIEPLSVVEKALERALRISEEPPKEALVVGSGTIGLLAVQALTLRGVAVTVHSREPRDHYRARLALRAGARYLESLDTGSRRFPLVIEATGSPEAAFLAIRALGPLGVCAILGGSSGAGDVSFSNLLLNNQVVFGSVNAGPEHFETAMHDLARFDPSLVNGMIRVLDFADIRASILSPPPDAPKLVHVLNSR